MVPFTCLQVQITVVDTGEAAPTDGAAITGRPAEQEQRVVDEIAEYQEGRYVGASEACWRLFGFSLHGRGANVERLAVHLPDQQAVTFDEDANMQVRLVYHVPYLDLSMEMNGPGMYRKIDI